MANVTDILQISTPHKELLSEILSDTFPQKWLQIHKSDPLLLKSEYIYM